MSDYVVDTLKRVVEMTGGLDRDGATVVLDGLRAAWAERDRLRQALQDLADEYDRLADRAHAAHVAVLEIPYIAARDALGQTSDGSRLNG